MGKNRYHTNYKGQLIDNTKDWEYKPLTKKTPIQMLNNLNDEFEKINELFQSVGFKEYDYSVLEKVMMNAYAKTSNSLSSLLTNAEMDEKGNVVYDGKVHSIEDVVDDLNSQRVQLWEQYKKIEDFESDIESMQQKINILYTEIMMAKEHMSKDEWVDFKERRVELEEKVGVKWIR